MPSPRQPPGGSPAATPTEAKSEATTYGQRDLIRQDRQRQLRGEPPADVDHWRPRSRSECQNGPRPCPFVGCKFHLFLDITPRGGLRVPHGEEPEALFELKETCALDVADRGGLTLEAVARLQSITRERVRQIELTALEKYKAAVRRFEAEAAASRSEASARSLLRRARAHGTGRPDLAGFIDEAQEDDEAREEEGDRQGPREHDGDAAGRAAAPQQVVDDAGGKDGEKRRPRGTAGEPLGVHPEL